MPILENLMEQVAEIINSKADRIVRFTSLYMLYAYGQTELHPETAKYCNFLVIGKKQQGRTCSNLDFIGGPKCSRNSERLGIIYGTTSIIGRSRVSTHFREM